MTGEKKKEKKGKKKKQSMLRTTLRSTTVHVQLQCSLNLIEVWTSAERVTRGRSRSATQSSSKAGLPLGPFGEAQVTECPGHAVYVLAGPEYNVY